MRGEKIKKITVIGLLFSLCAVLSIAEGMIPLDGLLPPGVKLGLANLPVMVCSVGFGWGYALLLAILKAALALINRGVTAGFLSFLGGMLSVCAVGLTLKLLGNRASCLCLGWVGAVFHNMGQLLGASVVTMTPFLVVQLPLLVLLGLGTGTLSGILFYMLMPQLTALNR